MPRTHRLFSPGIVLIGFIGILFGLALSNLPGCANNPVVAAEDTEQRAYAIYGTFVIIEEQAAQIMGNPNISAPIKNAIRETDRRAKPSADALAQAVRDYDAAARALKSGASTDDKLAIATANLQKWITQAQADVTDLATAVKTGG